VGVSAPTQLAAATATALFSFRTGSTSPPLQLQRIRITIGSDAVRCAVLLSTQHQCGIGALGPLPACTLQSAG